MPAIEFNHVWKKFRKGGGHTSLRDAISSAFSRRQPKTNNNQLSTSDSSFWALKDVSFTVEKGEALGIIGPNGAGKTTVLKLLSRIFRANKGEIVTNGKVSSLIELGAGFHPDLTGRENVYLNASILGMKKEEVREKFDSIVEFSGIGGFIDMPVKRYSSGMYVRLGFAVAIHCEPEILLIDEVLAVGDMSFKRRCLKRMDELRNNRDTTIVFVSHDLRSVETVCKKAIFLLDGRVTVRGSIKDVITTYQEYDMEKMEGVKRDENVSELQSRVSIRGIHLMRYDGSESNSFCPGEQVTVRVDYFAPERINNPVFVMRVERIDGLVCFIVRTRHSGIVMDDIEGQGSFQALFENLSLNAGSYILNAIIKDSNDLLVYGGGVQPFRVFIGEVDFGADAGIYFPEVEWRQTAKRE